MGVDRRPCKMFTTNKSTFVLFLHLPPPLLSIRLPPPTPQPPPCPSLLLSVSCGYYLHCAPSTFVCVCDPNQCQQDGKFTPSPSPNIWNVPHPCGYSWRYLPVIPPPGHVVRCTGTASCTGTYHKGHNCLGLNSENSMSTCLGSAELQCLLL